MGRATASGELQVHAAVAQPIGVSEYELTRELPDDLKPSLPSIEQIEAELGGDRDGL